MRRATPCRAARCLRRWPLPRDLTMATPGDPFLARCLEQAESRTWLGGWAGVHCVALWPARTGPPAAGRPEHWGGMGEALAAADR